MKDVFLILLSCVVAATIVYGVGAFISWNIHPGDWSTSTRVFASIFWLIGCYFAMYAAIVLTEK